MVDDRLVAPPTSQWHQLERPTEMPITIPFGSPAHAGDVVVRLWANYGMPREELLYRGLSEGGPNQSFSFSVTASDVDRMPTGCVFLTALLFYREDFDIATDKPTREAWESNRVAQVRWWLVVDDSLLDVSVADCPTPSSPEEP